MHDLDDAGDVRRCLILKWSKYINYIELRRREKHQLINPPAFLSSFTKDCITCRYATVLSVMLKIKNGGNVNAV